MNKLLLIFSAVLFSSCAPKIVTVNTETIRTEIQTVHDTFVDVRLMPSIDSIVTKDTISRIDRKTAVTTAKISRGLLYHTLEVKDVPIRIEFKYVNKVIRDTTTRTVVQPLSKADQNRINNYDTLKAKSKKQGKTVWKLIGLLSLSVLFILRKPLFAIIGKLIKPI